MPGSVTKSIKSNPAACKLSPNNMILIICFVQTPTMSHYWRLTDTWKMMRRKFNPIHSTMLLCHLSPILSGETFHKHLNLKLRFYSYCQQSNVKGVYESVHLSPTAGVHTQLVSMLCDTHIHVRITTRGQSWIWLIDEVISPLVGGGSSLT